MHKMLNKHRILFVRQVYFKSPCSLHGNIANTPHNDEKNKDSSNDSKSKKKIVVTRRSFPSSRKDSRVLEWKTASSAMKRLNWENTHLFGPVQSSKANIYSDFKIQESDEIIQHHTNIPITEPSDDLETDSFIDATPNPSKGKPELNLSVVLEFPLMNKQSGEENDVNRRVNEMNNLRKYLEEISISVPSVSKILEKTMPKESVENLERWKQNMIVKLGVEGFKQYQMNLLNNGASFHTSINNFLTLPPGSKVSVEDANLGHWKSLTSAFPYISNVKLLEERLSHPFLCYKGILDCFAMYKDHLVVIDWKTSKRAKHSLSSTFDNPIQIAAYVGALNFDPKFQYLANKGLIVVAYEDGTPATLHFMNEAKMQQYWREWLKRVKLYWEIVKNDIK